MADNTKKIEKKLSKMVEDGKRLAEHGDELIRIYPELAVSQRILKEYNTENKALLRKVRVMLKKEKI